MIVAEMCLRSFLLHLLNCLLLWRPLQVGPPCRLPVGYDWQDLQAVLAPGALRCARWRYADRNWTDAAGVRWLEVAEPA